MKEKTPEEILELREMKRYANEKWRLLNPEKAKEVSDKYKGYRREYSKNYYAVNGERIRKEKEEFIRKNPELYKIQCKKYTDTYYQKHKEEVKARALEYYYRQKELKNK